MLTCTLAACNSAYLCTARMILHQLANTRSHPHPPFATGNSTYLYAAHRHWLAAGGRKGHRDKWGGEINPYISWDSLYGPAAVNLLR